LLKYHLKRLENLMNLDLDSQIVSQLALIDQMMGLRLNIASEPSQKTDEAQKSLNQNQPNPQVSENTHPPDNQSSGYQ